jgi:hypothetical protein
MGRGTGRNEKKKGSEVGDNKGEQKARGAQADPP